MQTKTILLCVLIFHTCRPNPLTRKPHTEADHTVSILNEGSGEEADLDDQIQDPLHVSHDKESDSDNSQSEHEIKSGHASDSAHRTNATGTHHEVHRFEVVHWNWDHVSAPYIISLWLLLACVAKIGFHVSERFSSIFPDSALLIVLGLIVGAILFIVQADEHSFHLNNDVFFLFLLPPIVFDAGYFMPNRAFFDNLGTILCYAVIGTLWNTFTIGMSLYLIGLTGAYSVEIKFLHILVFASLISAVDPVAVLCVFEEIHVHELLYIVVFGESLLNDAVTVVLYNMFNAFSEIGAANLIAVDYIKGFFSFFVVAIGGVIIGLIWAAIVSYTTKWTKHVSILEPLFVFLMAYCAYLTAEMVHVSGILAIVFCGIAMKQYVEGNISSKSHTTVKYFLKMLSSSTETVIFMFLGLSTVSSSHDWNAPFICLTLLFCLVYRALGVLILTFFVNKLRTHKLHAVEQFIMAYGGLRGAIAYGLVIALSANVFPNKQMFVSAAIVVIYFTVFIQGLTIKPLTNLLKVKKDIKRLPTMNEEIFSRFVDHALSGIEDICSFHGHNWLRFNYEHFNAKYLQPFFMRNPPKTMNSTIVRTFTKLSMKDAMENLDKYGSFMHTVQSANSLSTMHRAWSFAGLSADANSPMSGVDTTQSSPCLDMHSLDVKGGKKQLVDSKLHHLLQHNTYRPQKMHHDKYRRHDMSHKDEPHGQHLHHHERLRLRHMLSHQSELYQRIKNEKKHAQQERLAKVNELKGTLTPPPVKKSVSFSLNPTEESPRGSAPTSPAAKTVGFFVQKEAEHQQNELPITLEEQSDSESDQEAVSFTAKIHKPEYILTEAEKMLPWKNENTVPAFVRQGSIKFPEFATNEGRRFGNTRSSGGKRKKKRIGSFGKGKVVPAGDKFVPSSKTDTVVVEQAQNLHNGSVVENGVEDSDNSAGDQRVLDGAAVTEYED